MAHRAYPGHWYLMYCCELFRYGVHSSQSPIAQCSALSRGNPGGKDVTLRAPSTWEEIDVWWSMPRVD